MNNACGEFRKRGPMEMLGVDVGGSGIKAALVDVGKGVFIGERLRLPTPDPPMPDSMAAVVAELVTSFGWEGRFGCGFPAVVRQGQVCTAANISTEWIGVDGSALLESATGCPVTLVNDADAAGLAEVRHGAGRGRKGSVLIVTLGTGIGSSLFVDGRLVPNTEFGHIQINGQIAEKWASAGLREQKKMPWEEWAERVDDVLKAMHFYVWPELIIVGGGVSKKHKKFLPRLTVPTNVVPAELRNAAGIVGAAIAAADEIGQGDLAVRPGVVV